MDFGASYSDADYKSRNHLTDDVVSRCGYLRNISPGELIAQTYTQRGSEYAKENESGKALQDFATADAILSKNNSASGRDPHFYLSRGAIKLRFNKFNDAIEDFNRTLSLDPRFTRAYTDRCDAYRGLHRYDDAIDDCNKAIKLSGENVAAYELRAKAEYLRDRYQEAVSDFGVAIASDAHAHPAGR